MRPTGALLLALLSVATPPTPSADAARSTAAPTSLSASPRPSRQATETGGERFSCYDRAPGFYADIASECQMYHMCDDAGRLFTHACPERTRFQQRTMVCDHWYMVECGGPEHEAVMKAQRGGNAFVGASTTAPAPAPAPAASALAPVRKAHRHSQRVPASFPYRQRNNTTPRSTTFVNPKTNRENFSTQEYSSTTQQPSFVNPEIVRESFPSQSFSSTTQRSFIPDVLNYSRETVIVHPPPPKNDRHQQNFRGQTTRGSFFPTSTPSTGFSGSFKFDGSFSEGDNAVSIPQRSFPSPGRARNFGGSSDLFSSTVVSPPTQEAPTIVVIQKYKENPFIESYLRNSFVSSTTSSPLLTQITETNYSSEEDDDDDDENKIEIFVPDPRKMFYIPDPRYDPGDVIGDQSNAVLVIDLPLPYQRQGKMKFRRSGHDEATNPQCPRCHPSFLIPGQCHPCVVIK